MRVEFAFALGEGNTKGDGDGSRGAKGFAARVGAAFALALAFAFALALAFAFALVPTLALAEGNTNAGVTGKRGPFVVPFVVAAFALALALAFVGFVASALTLWNGFGNAAFAFRPKSPENGFRVANGFGFGAAGLKALSSARRSSALRSGAAGSLRSRIAPTC